MIFLEYSSFDFQFTRPPEAPSNLYHASILEGENVVVSHDFELRQDLKLSQMLQDIEKKVTQVPEDSKKQKEKAKTGEVVEREEPHIEFGKIISNRVSSGELGKYFNKSMKEAQKNSSGLRILERLVKE